MPVREIPATSASRLVVDLARVIEQTSEIADRRLHKLVRWESTAGIEHTRWWLDQIATVEHHHLADEFAQAIRKAPDVVEIWLVEAHPTLVVSVLLTDVSLDRELQLRAQFATLTRKHDAELRVYAESGSRANLARRGDRLG